MGKCTISMNTTIWWLLVTPLQLVWHVGVAVCSSMLAIGFRENNGSIHFSTYIPWYIFSIAMTIISILLFMLIVLSTCLGCKTKLSGFWLWMSMIISVSLLQIVTMLSMLVVLLIQIWDKCALTVLTPPEVDYRVWKISLTQTPADNLSCFLTEHYGIWLLIIGACWSSIIFVNCMYVRHVKKTFVANMKILKNAQSNTNDENDAMSHNDRNTVPQCSRCMRMDEIPKSNENNQLYPFSGLHSIMADEAAFNNTVIPKSHNEYNQLYQLPGIYNVMANETVNRTVAGPTAPTLNDIETGLDTSGKAKLNG